jgi:hypothetical protein
MVESMKGLGMKIECMAEESLHEKMVEFTQANIRKVKNKGLVLS